MHERTRQADWLRDRCILLKNSCRFGARWLIQFSRDSRDMVMMGPKQETQAALFYKFSLEDHVPQDHLLRSIDRFIDLNDIR